MNTVCIKRFFQEIGGGDGMWLSCMMTMQPLIKSYFKMSKALPLIRYENITDCIYGDVGLGLREVSSRG